MMNFKTFFDVLYTKKVLKFTSKSFLQYLTSYTLLETISTGVVGDIEVYQGNNDFIISENDGRGNYYLRPFQTRDIVEKFLSERSATYDRMWDGCGCKINYDDVWEPFEPVFDINLS